MELPSPAEPTVLHIRIPSDVDNRADRAIAYASFFAQVAAASKVEVATIGVPTSRGVQILLAEPWPHGSQPPTARTILGLLRIAETL